jgi:hypothetical protein
VEFYLLIPILHSWKREGGAWARKLFLRFCVLDDNDCQLRFTSEQRPLLVGDCAWEGKCGTRSSVTHSRYSGSDRGSLGYLQHARFTTVCDIQRRDEGRDKRA